MVERRCHNCTTWYDKKRGNCPECAAPQRPILKWWYKAQLNNALYAQAERSTIKHDFHETKNRYKKVLQEGM